MTAGVASAEVTFSGKGEAGVYRLAPTAATTGTAAIEMAELAGDTAATDEGKYTYNAAGELTLTAASGTAGVDATAISTAKTAVENAITVAKGNIAAHQLLMDADTTLANYNTEKDLKTADEAELARLEATLAKLTAVAATGKGATPKLVAYSGYDFNVAVSGASDNGMTFAMGFDMGAGSIADQDDDRAMDAQGGSIATDELTITYAGYTVGIGNDNIDDLYDDTQNGDVSLSGSLGDLTFSLVTDMDDDVKAVTATTVYDNAAGNAAGADSVTSRAAVAAVYNPTSYAIGYTMGNVAFSMAGTEHDDRGHAAAKMSLNYTVSDAKRKTRV